MLGELAQVKGEWAALFWAVGGAAVLVKHALVALVFPARNTPALLPDGGLFVKEGPMRKASLSIIGGCVILTLLFLLAPTFRQGLGVALMQWRTMSQVNADWPPPTSSALRTLEGQAEKNHDAEALAFVAVRTWDSAESTRLADEAVQLDPKLTWIYGMASPSPAASETWIQKLKEWDPQNALPYFMEAGNIDIEQVEADKVPHTVAEESPAWKNAMAAAFASLKLDTYTERLRELDRKIAYRYGLSDPYQIVWDRCFPCLPSFAAWNSSRYAKWELKTAETLETQGAEKAALQKYWSVIRFAEVANGARMRFMYMVLKDAYERVEAISEKQGDKRQAALYSYLAGDALQQRDSLIAEWGQTISGNPVIEGNADVLRVSGLLLPICGAILLICALTIVVKSRTLRLSVLRAGRGVAALGLGSAVGLLLSSALLYASYWPYAETLREYLKTGNEGRLDVLMAFLNDAQLPLGGSRYMVMNVGMYQYYFWLTVIVLGAVALLVIAARHLRSRLRIRAAS